MSDELTGWRPPALLPDRRGAPAWTLALVGLGLFAATLGAVLALAVAPLKTALAPRLVGDLTVVMAARADGLESADAAVARTAELLGGTEHVRGARILAPDISDKMIARLVRLPAAEARLVSVDLSGGDGRGVASALSREGLVFAVSDRRHGALDHAVQSQRLAGLALGAGGVALGLAAAVLAGVLRVRGCAERVALVSLLGASRGRLLSSSMAPVLVPMVTTAAVGAGAAAAVLLRHGAGAGLIAPPLRDLTLGVAIAVFAAGALGSVLAATAGAAASLRRRTLP
ncbi:MAG TPA: hypothetical protein VG248_13790 [Caulobacteraceae bacterium]|jgi:hypothetical protein|nr:hypothetical protein [Caulobacteraceae bacterium]